MRGLSFFCAVVSAQYTQTTPNYFVPYGAQQVSYGASVTPSYTSPQPYPSASTPYPPQPYTPYTPSRSTAPQQATSSGVSSSSSSSLSVNGLFPYRVASQQAINFATNPSSSTFSSSTSAITSAPQFARRPVVQRVRIQRTSAAAVRSAGQTQSSFGSPPVSVFNPRNASALRPVTPITPPYASSSSSSSGARVPFSNPATIQYVPKDSSSSSSSSGPSGDPTELYGKSPAQLPSAARVANPLKSGQVPSVVSFDFDGTLQDNAAGGGVGAPYPQVIAFLKQYAQEGAKIVITTQRDSSANDEIEDFLEQNNIAQYVTHIYNSDTGDKTQSLLQSGAQVHVDDRISNLQTLMKTLPGLQLFTVIDGAVIPYPSGLQ